MNSVKAAMFLRIKTIINIPGMSTQVKACVLVTVCSFTHTYTHTLHFKGAAHQVELTSFQHNGRMSAA